MGKGDVDPVCANRPIQVGRSVFEVGQERNSVMCVMAIHRSREKEIEMTREYPRNEHRINEGRSQGRQKGVRTEDSEGGGETEKKKKKKRGTKG